MLSSSLELPRNQRSYPELAQKEDNAVAAQVRMVQALRKSNGVKDRVHTKSTERRAQARKKIVEVTKAMRKRRGIGIGIGTAAERAVESAQRSKRGSLCKTWHIPKKKYTLHFCEVPGRGQYRCFNASRLLCC